MLRSQTSDTFDGNDWFIGESPPCSVAGSAPSTAPNSPVHPVGVAAIRYSASTELSMALDKLLNDEKKTEDHIKTKLNKAMQFTPLHNSKKKRHSKKSERKAKAATPTISPVVSVASLSFALVFGEPEAWSTRSSYASSLNDVTEVADEAHAVQALSI